MGYLIAAIIGLFFLSKSGVSLGSILPTSVTGTPVDVPPPAIAIQGTGQLSASQQNQFAFVQASNAALNAIPVAGPAIAAVANALTSSLKAASQKRAQEATSENTAVAAAVPGWDQAMAQIQAAYNNGGISAGQAIALVQTAWSNYWTEVTPKIQPGRNGCNGGALSPQQANQQFPGMKQCSGSWGAACCVGYADLANGMTSAIAAINQTDSNGAPAVANIPAVLASKYGGTNRAAYTITYTRPSQTFSL